MPLNRDDIINEVTASAQRGITCDGISIDIDKVTRSLRVHFSVSDITVLADNTTYSTPRMPIDVDLSAGTTTFDLYNRRTGVKTGSTRTYDNLSAILMSLFFDAYAKSLA